MFILSLASRILKLSVIAVTIFLMVSLGAVGKYPPVVKQGESFQQIPFKLESFQLNDLGIVDANGDSFLDIFTTNHSSRQSLLRGDGSGDFKDVLTQWEMDQDRDFPNLENSSRAPTLTDPGLYIYRRNDYLYIKANQSEEFGPISGSLEVSLPVTVEEEQDVDVTIKESYLPTTATKSLVDFSFNGDGLLVLKGFIATMAVPHSFKLDHGVRLSSIHIGQGKQHPQFHEFDLIWRDRHSMAWTDLNGDGWLDAFVGRGAVKGLMFKLPEQLNDELFISNNGTYGNHIGESGLLKKDCAGRQSAWVDFDSDGRLDLYQGCGRGKGEYENPYPNQL